MTPHLTGLAENLCTLGCFRRRGFQLRQLPHRGKRCLRALQQEAENWAKGRTYHLWGALAGKHKHGVANHCGRCGCECNSRRTPEGAEDFPHQRNSILRDSKGPANRVYLAACSRRAAANDRRARRLLPLSTSSSLERASAPDPSPIRCLSPSAGRRHPDASNTRAPS